MNFSEKHPIYLQISDYICESILNRKWKGEDRIPSIRELAVTIEVNPNTVMHAYQYLQDKEIIYNQRGIGFFISEDAYRRIKEMKKAEFIEQELPRLFKMMRLLGMDLKDLETYYKNFDIRELKEEKV